MNLQQFHGLLEHAYEDVYRVRPVINRRGNTLIVSGWIHCGYSPETGWWLWLKPSDRLSVAYPCLGGQGEPTGFAEPWPVLVEVIRADGHFLIHQAIDTVARARGFDAGEGYQGHHCSPLGVAEMS